MEEEHIARGEEMNMEVFASIVTVIFGVGFLLPIIYRSERGATISLWMALGASAIGSLVSGAAWFGFVKILPWKLDLNLWHGITEDLAKMPELQLEFRLDSLSAFFVFLASVFSVIVAIYSFAALKALHYQKFRLRIASAYNLFVWATLVVFVAYDVFSVIVALEIMTLAFGYLAIYKHSLYQDEELDHPIDEIQQKNARLAPQVYLMISHTSTAFLLVAFLILSTQGKSLGFSFDRLINSRTEISPDIAFIAFLLGLIGLGIRAGLLPAHIWVPLVHPSSPTTTHAFSLGIAIKVAVYLMYRFFFQFLLPEYWWGYIVLLIAVFTALVNVWYAIYSHDLKTALAYHSIENIGIMCVGIGLAMVFWKDHPGIASLALLASLYHLLNHAIFKGLLYLATGAIDYLTHQTVELDRLGGLIKHYGFTSAMFLIGSFAIAGFPPFNGFISEWLTLQSFFKGLEPSLQIFGQIIILLSSLILVASFALTAFCFYKMAGITLLGQPRLPEKEREKWEPRDVPLSMKSVMGIMAVMCLLLGIFPGPVAYKLNETLQTLGTQDLAVNSSSNFSFSVNIESSREEQNTPDGLPIFPILGTVLGLTLIPGFVNWRWRKLQQPNEAWNCGTPLGNSAMSQYTSTAISFLLRNTFPLARINHWFSAIHDYLPAHNTLSESTHNHQEIVEYFRVTYNLLIQRGLKISRRFGFSIQNGDIRQYLSYVFGATLIALAIFILWNLPK